MILYINNLFIIDSNKTKINELEEKLKKKFEILKLNLVLYYIEIKFIYLIKEVLLIQRNYNQNMLERFNVIDCFTIAIPIEEDIRL
uniref:Reverse transcriptase Ty1/copia-type domain-containing protein n=1 Tax=Physcomitrium patens TaxID=3218 RepID=A0A2K1KUR3_PHYPA|nr:hypothetical protein PHYPA_004502 [Physcomitrium patens]